MCRSVTWTNSWHSFFLSKLYILSLWTWQTATLLSRVCDIEERSQVFRHLKALKLLSASADEAGTTSNKRRSASTWLKRDHGPREPCSSWFLSLLSRFCRCNWQWTWPAAPLGTGTAALDTGQTRHQLDQRVGLSPAWPGAVALPVQTALSAVLLQCQGLGRTVHGSTPDLWMERRAQLGQHVSSVAFVNVASLLVRCPKM